MLIEVHLVQNHSPSNLNRDDIGAPKTCYFGGVLRSRLSSQCIKRSIRKSAEFRVFEGLPHDVRTRQLARLIAGEGGSGGVDAGRLARAKKLLELSGFATKPSSKEEEDNAGSAIGPSTKALVSTTDAAIVQMASLLKDDGGMTDEALAKRFAEIIATNRAAPGIALFGRMLEPGAAEGSVKRVIKELGEHRNVEAAVQVAHAISTHEARQEVDYYVAVDDVPGDDAGAGFVNEAGFSSACFYKYLSINWGTLLENLASQQGSDHLARALVSSLLRSVALVNPSGRQNSFAAHNPPDGVLIEFRDFPLSYANAFAEPVVPGPRGLVGESIARLSQYAHDLDTGYGKPERRYWFSPNLRQRLVLQEGKGERPLISENTKNEGNFGTLNELLTKVDGVLAANANPG